MDRKIVTFMPPKCDIVIIEKRKIWYWKFYKVLRNDGKEFWIVGKSHSYKKDIWILTIKLKNWRLPIILEVEKEFIIDNTKTTW
jgi:hypothetical protein